MVFLFILSCLLIPLTVFQCAFLFLGTETWRNKSTLLDNSIWKINSNKNTNNIETLNTFTKMAFIF